MAAADKMPTYIDQVPRLVHVGHLIHQLLVVDSQAALANQCQSPSAHIDSAAAKALIQEGKSADQEGKSADHKAPVPEGEFADFPEWNRDHPASMTAPSRSNMQRLDLPLLEATALWQTRKMIALRAIFLLQWLQRSHKTPSSTHHVMSTATGLAVTINQILQECLSGIEPAVGSSSTSCTEAQH